MISDLQSISVSPSMRRTKEAEQIQFPRYVGRLRFIATVPSKIKTKL